MIAGNRKVVVGMSGGVDSSMAAVFLKEEGWSPIGVSLRLPVWENSVKKGKNTPGEALKAAESVCNRLGIPHHIYDVREEFKNSVVEYFLDEFKEGRTPNPCVVCNQRHKFKFLLRFAREEGVGRVASGHYARKRYDQEAGSYELVKPKDKEKDQTYYLVLLTQDQLSHIIFPLGDKSKKEVKRRAEEMGLEEVTGRAESQNWCFVTDRALPRFLRERLGERKGKIVDKEGEVLGEHEGVWFYTVGQRKGLGLGGGPYYVRKVRPDTNEVLVTKNKDEVYGRELTVKSFNLISGEKLFSEMEVRAKIRYRDNESEAKVKTLKSNELRVIFKKPQFAPTPGQFCAFYQEDVCLGGGVINNTYL